MAGRLSGMWLFWVAAQAAPAPVPAQRSPLAEVDVTQRVREAAAEPNKLISLADQVSAKDARRVLHGLLRWAGEKDRGPVAQPLLAAFVKALPRSASSPDDILEVMGAAARTTVVRQVFYRHYREQWIFEHPLPCCVVFDCEKGADPRVLTVLPLPEGVP